MKHKYAVDVYFIKHRVGWIKFSSEVKAREYFQKAIIRNSHLGYWYKIRKID